MNRRKIILIAALVVLLVAGLLTHGFGLWGRRPDNQLVLSGNVDIRQVDLGLSGHGADCADSL